MTQPNPAPDRCELPDERYTTVGNSSGWAAVFHNGDWLDRSGKREPPPLVAYGLYEQSYARYVIWLWSKAQPASEELDELAAHQETLKMLAAAQSRNAALVEALRECRDPMWRCKTLPASRGLQGDLDNAIKAIDSALAGTEAGQEAEAAKEPG